jgi:hypothetical protein
MNYILSYFYTRYYFNSKILSVGRIFVSLIILLDLFFRYQNFKAHYTNNGVLPTNVIKTYYPFYQYYFSIHNFIESTTLLHILFWTHFICALILLIGWNTRLFTIINFVLILSLHHRNPVILQGGDDLLRITLFYMIFLPWGSFYSIDSFLQMKKKLEIAHSTTNFSWIFVVFQINIGLVYLFSALLKTADEWRISGDAIYYALSLYTLRTYFGNLIYQQYQLTKVLTFIVYYGFEIIAPLLIIFPPTILLRKLGAISIILLHLFIVSTLKVGIFPFVGITTALMLLVNQKDMPSKFTTNKNELIFAIIIFVLILRYNLATLQVPYFSITLWEDRFLNCVGLSQRWNMFSPGVKRYDGWLVLRGIKSNNTEWDLIHNTPNLHTEGTTLNKNFLKGDRWRKFLENYEQQQYNFIKPYFCYYLIQQWNEQHPENTIEALNILFVKKETLPNYQYKTEIENLSLCNINFEKQSQ